MYSDGFYDTVGSYGYGTVDTVPRHSVTTSSYPLSYSNRYRYPSHYGYSTYGRSMSRCYRCGCAPCRCSHLHRYGRTGIHHYPSHYYHSSRHRDHSSYSKSSHSETKLKHRPNSYQIAGGSVGRGRTKPKGFHSVDWYKKKGYDVSKLKLRNEKGEYYGKKSSSKKKKR
jgi:hypothetical protein